MQFAAHGGVTDAMSAMPYIYYPYVIDTIDGSGNLKTAAIFNFETKTTYSIRVRSTDQSSLFFEKRLRALRGHYLAAV